MQKQDSGMHKRSSTTHSNYQDVNAYNLHIPAPSFHKPSKRLEKESKAIDSMMRDMSDYAKTNSRATKYSFQTVVSNQTPLKRSALKREKSLQLSDDEDNDYA